MVRDRIGDGDRAGQEGQALRGGKVDNPLRPAPLVEPVLTNFEWRADGDDDIGLWNRAQLGSKQRLIRGGEARGEEGDASLTEAFIEDEPIVPSPFGRELIAGHQVQQPTQDQFLTVVPFHPGSL
jgi:hypothetical protein